MATPHAVGVAALIVSEYGKKDRSQGGPTLPPDRVQKILQKTATDVACPAPRLYHYDGLPATAGIEDAYCEGPVKRNGLLRRRPHRRAGGGAEGPVGATPGTDPLSRPHSRGLSP